VRAPDRIRREPRGIRWVDYARRSMQRLGYLKILVAIADSLGSTTLQGLTTRFEAAVTAKHRVPDHILPRVRDYVTEQNLHHRYPGLHARGREAASSRPPVMQVQDLYLSDPALPARSGAMTGDQERKGYRHAVYVEMPPWAVQLGLLRRQNYTATDRAKALLELAPTMEAFRAFEPDSNPFMLASDERFFFLFSLIDADGDLLRVAYRQMTSRFDGFTRTDFGETIASALEEFLRDRLRRPSTGMEQEVARRMRDVLKSVHEQSGSGMGPKESVATPRTEPLVDCGVLYKPVRNKYEYAVTEGGRAFLRRLIESESVTEFIERGLGKATAELLGLSPKPASGTEILAGVASAYSRMRSGLGYCSLREAGVLAVAQATKDGLLGYEIADAEAAVVEAARTYGRRIRLTQTRRGPLAQFRIDSKLVDSLTCTS